MKTWMKGNRKYCWAAYFLLLLGLSWSTNRFMPSWMFSLEHWFKEAVNVIPFKTMVYYFNSLWDGSLNVNIPVRFFIMNILIGISMGVLFAFLNRKASLVQMLTFSCVFFMIFEGAALLLRIGIFDVDSILIRTAVAVGGYQMIQRYVLTNKKVIGI